MKLNLVFLLLILAVAIAFSQENATKIERAQQEVKEILKDPDSAKFKNVKIVINTEGVESVVGKVNARNSYGGYTGYKLFSVTRGVVTIVDPQKESTLDIYKLTGALGDEEETNVRLKQEKRELVKKLEDQAKFSCEVIWTLLTNVIVEGQTKDAALDAAISAMKARAVSNGTTLPEVQALQLRKAFEQSLNQTLLDKKQVKAIKRNPAFQKQVIFPLMYAKTLNALKLQLGVVEY